MSTLELQIEKLESERETLTRVTELPVTAFPTWNELLAARRLAAYALIPEQTVDPPLLIRLPEEDEDHK